MKGLIAEIGQHHFGDVNTAKCLIRIAHESGANFVKMQALDHLEFKGGSMPREFYRQCDLGMGGYIECIEYAAELGIPIFFSVFGAKYMDLVEHYQDMPYKIAGSQFKSFGVDDLQYWNGQKRPVVTSIPNLNEQELDDKHKAISNMHLMVVNRYLDDDANFQYMAYCSELFKKPIGYSDHTIGLNNCLRAIVSHGCELVEKHFNVFGDQKFQGKIYRDSIHAANPNELERLAKLMQG